MSLSWKTGLVATALVATTVYAAAQMMPQHGKGAGHTGHMGMPAQAEQHQGGMGGQMHGNMMQMHRQMMQGHGGGGGHGMMHQRTGATAQPSLPGQDAFGAIQEVVRMLDADPSTDWSKVNITALREHLIDMNEVMLRARADEKRLDTGIEIAVTGEGRTRDAIKRMVLAHSRELAGTNRWSATGEDLPNGVKLTVTTADQTQVPKLQALGFAGIMVQGGHHQAHHLAMAKGTFQH
jgi:hypothetical protein